MGHGRVGRDLEPRPSRDGGADGYQLEPDSPFGGFRAIESYTELKTVLLPLTDEMM